MSRYILYARKSSESEDRQVLSIESQIRELTEHARERNLTVTSVLSESRSAKAPGREIFGKLLATVGKGQADGILCWKLDRLARNPVDGGALIWALDEGKIREIATREKSFTNRGDDKFWMQMEFGIAKKYVDDLSDNVRRGNRTKLAQGWLPGVPPLGYLNDRAEKTIIPDPVLFPLVRRIWTLVLAGRSPLEVMRVANDEWGFRTRRHRRFGGGPLQQSCLYKMLANPFYFGLIIRKGETHAGAHSPMITKDEFDLVQDFLGRPNRFATKKRVFAFSGLIRCGECGSMITAEEKTNRYGSHYVYYRCTKRKAHVDCSQKTIRVERLEQQIRELLERIRISDRFRDWALKHLRAAHEDAVATRKVVERSVHDASLDNQKQIDRLIQMSLRGLITEEEFTEKKRQLVADQLRLRERRDDAEGRSGRWLELAEMALNFANQARERFEEGTLEDKREILVALGSHFTLKDRILRIQLQKPLLWIEEGRQIARWWGLVDQFRTFFMEHPDVIRWPAFVASTESDLAYSSVKRMTAQGG